MENRKLIVLVGLGYGTFLAVNIAFMWGGLSFAMEADESVRNLSQLFRIGATVAIALAPLTVLAIAVLTGFRRSSRSLRVVFTALLALSMAMFLAASLWCPSASVVFLIVGAVFGITNGMYFLLWGEVLSRLEPRASFAAMLIMGGVSSLSSIALFQIEGFFTPRIAAFVLLVPAFLLFEHCANATEALSEKSTVHAPRLGKSPARSTLRPVLVPVLSVAALAFEFNAIREVAASNFNGTLINTLSTAGVLLAAAILGVASFVKKRPPDIDSIYPWVALGLATLLIPTLFLESFYWPVLTALVSIAYTFMEVLLRTILAKIAYTRRDNPFIVFGFGEGMVFSAIGLGTLVGSLVYLSGLSKDVLVAIVLMVCIYLLVFPFVLGKLETKKRLSDFEGAARGNLETRCAALAETNGISPSELKVMVLLAQKLSYAAIAQKLMLSENTVRSHCKSIYRKLAIHSKQELYDLAMRKP